MVKAIDCLPDKKNLMEGAPGVSSRPKNVYICNKLVQVKLHFLRNLKNKKMFTVHSVPT